MLPTRPHPLYPCLKFTVVTVSGGMAGDCACCLDNAVCGYHIHRRILTPVTGEQLNAVYKDDNEHDARAGAIMKATIVVGH